MLIRRRAAGVMPVSALSANYGLLVNACLVFLSFGVPIRSAVLEASAGSVIVIALAVAVGLAPTAVAFRALRQGLAWGPIIVTVAAVWASIYVLPGGPLLSWSSLLVSTITIIAVWQSSARQYGQKVRESKRDGLAR